MTVLAAALLMCALAGSVGAVYCYVERDRAAGLWLYVPVVILVLVALRVAPLLPWRPTPTP